MENNNAQKIIDLERKLNEFEQVFNLHHHSGSREPRISILDVFRLVETVSVVPTGIAPKGVFDQIKIYSNAGTLRLYIYDVTGAAWHYTTLT